MELGAQYHRASLQGDVSLAFLLARYRKELALKWTREVPTRPGNYARKGDDDTGEWWTGKVGEWNGQLVFNMVPIALMSGGWWAGPISEPEMP
jgi:hypothetical protein